MRMFDSNAPLGDRFFWVACIGLALLGLGFRLPTLSSRSLWLDEAYSAWFAAQPLHSLWTDVPRYETHPPLYYSLLKGWTALFGRSEAGLRSLSVVASVATILLLAWSGRALRAGPFGDRVALLAALLLAINGGSVFFAQQARPYALEAFAASAAILSALILLQRLRAQAGHPFSLRPLWTPILGLALAAGATLWLHDTGIFVAFGVWVGLTVALLLFVPGPRGGQALAIALPGFLAVLLWSPFLPMFIHQNTGMISLSYWIAFSPLDLVTAWFLAAGGYLPFIPAVFLFVPGVRAAWRSHRPQAALVLTIVLLPLAAMLSISYFIKPIYIDRLFEWMAPTVVGLIAIGMLTGKSGPSLRLCAALLFIALGLFSTWISYFFETEDWRGIVTSIADGAKPGDLVVAMPNELDAPLHYYLAGRTGFPDVLTIPAPFPALGLQRTYIGNLGAPKIIPADRDLVRAALQNHQRVWLIERSADLYDPQGLIRAEIATARHLVSSRKDTSISIDLFD